MQASRLGGDFRSFGNLALLGLGLLALLAISPIGHVAAVLAMITVIGIPIALLIVAIPSIFLIALALRLATGSWIGFRSGRIHIGIGFALALVAMADFFVFRAWRVNDWLDARAADLVAGDKDQVRPTGPIETLAIIHRTLGAPKKTTPCDDLCRRALLTGAAKQVLVVPAPMASRGGNPGGGAERTTFDPAPELLGTAWRLEQRERCDDPGVLGSEQTVRVPEPPRPAGARFVPPIASDVLMRLRIASGTCLISEPMTLDHADALVIYGPLHSGLSSFRAGYDAWADTLSAWQIGFWLKQGDRLEEHYRRTGVAWERLPGVLIPTFAGGAELRTVNAWLRRTALMNRTAQDYEVPIGAFLTSRLGLDLRPGPDGAASPDGADTPPPAALRVEQAKVVDRILAAATAPNDTEAKVVADYLGGEAFRPGRDVEDEAVLRRVLAILEDRRLDLPHQAIGAVRAAARHSPASAPAMAAALMARLDALPASPTGGAAKARIADQIGAVTGSFAELPAAAVGPYRSKAVALMGDRNRRIAATRLLDRLDLFGPSIAPEIFAMMDDAFALRTSRAREEDEARRQWAAIWRSGARSICRLAPQLPGRLDDLRTRARTLAEERLRLADDVVATAMLRMGASDDDIRAALAIDPADQKATRSFANTLRRARRDDACR